MNQARYWNGREWVYGAIHHIDGNPRNNDRANLRLVEVRCNRQDPPLKPFWLKGKPTP